MTVEARFMFSSGLAKTVHVPRGTLARIDRHVERIRSTFDLGGVDLRDWSWAIRKRIAATGSGAIDEVVLCELAKDHEQLVDYVWRVMGSDHAGETEEISPERAAEFWDALTLSISVPVHRWTADYYAHKMKHAYEVMRGRESLGETFTANDHLTERQAAAVIILFSQWMDEHDIRLDVPLDHDSLGRSDTGDYDWCEKCGPIHSDDFHCRARTCKHGAECCLRRQSFPEEFEDESEGDL